MKTIVFHSYKGGVGRTLALANFAIALSKIRKCVLILDWDFDAPGVPVKFHVDGEVKNGYVDYLFEIREEYGNKIKSTNLEEREKKLKDRIIKIQGTNISILPAGKRSNPKYWEHASSSEFQRFFYYSDPIERNKNIKFFSEDIQLLKESNDEKNVDYLLVDCKSSDARAVIPLMLFADKIVELFNCNNEGVFGEILARLASEALKKKKEEYGVHKEGIGFISAMTRVPTDFSIPEALIKYNELALPITKCFDMTKDELANELFIIHEHRELERIESLLLDDIKNNFLLTHDYIALFIEIVKDDDEIKNEISGLGFKDWKSALGIAQEVELIEQYFILQVHKGILLNTDNQPNV